MSRSYNKNPGGPVCQSDAGVMKQWKVKANRKLRRLDVEIPNGKSYRKIEDVWGSPSDGKTWFEDDKKRMRK